MRKIIFGGFTGVSWGDSADDFAALLSTDVLLSADAVLSTDVLLSTDVTSGLDVDSDVELPSWTAPRSIVV